MRITCVKNLTIVTALFCLLGNSASATEQVGVCNLGTTAGLQRLLNDASLLPDEPIAASFGKPILPGGQRVRLTAEQSFSAWESERVCGVVIWRDNPVSADKASCIANAHSVCTAITTVNISGQPEDGTKTLLRFIAPQRYGNTGWQDMRQPGTLYMAGYDGDDVKFTYVQALSISGEAVSKFWTFLFIGSIVVVVVFMAGNAAKQLAANPAGVSYASFFNPVKLTSGIYGKASISRLQFFSFSLIVAFLVVYTWARTGLLLELSSDLLLLMGISGGGAAGAKMTAVSKKRLNPEPRIYMEKKGWTSTQVAAGARGAHISDLVLTDGKLNVYKFQMAIFSVIVAIVLISSGISETGVVTIPDTFLGLMGLGQGVYIAGKAVSESDASDFEKIITDMRDKEKIYLDAQESASHIGEVQDKATFHANNQTYKTWAPGDAAVRKAYREYIDHAETARLTFQTLYGITISDEKLLPSWRSWA